MALTTRTNLTARQVATRVESLGDPLTPNTGNNSLWNRINTAQANITNLQNSVGTRPNTTENLWGLVGGTPPGWSNNSSWGTMTGTIRERILALRNSSNLWSVDNSISTMDMVNGINVNDVLRRLRNSNNISLLNLPRNDDPITIFDTVQTCISKVIPRTIGGVTTDELALEAHSVNGTTLTPIGILPIPGNQSFGRLTTTKLNTNLLFIRVDVSTNRLQNTTVPIQQTGGNGGNNWRLRTTFSGNPHFPAGTYILVGGNINVFPIGSGGRNQYSIRNIGRETANRINLGISLANPTNSNNYTLNQANWFELELQFFVLV